MHKPMPSFFLTGNLCSVNDSGAYIAKTQHRYYSIWSWENLKHIGKMEELDPLEIIRILNSLLCLVQKVKYQVWNLNETEQSYD